MTGGLQPNMVDEIAARIAELRRSFDETPDVTTQEFMRLSEARDALNDTLRLMYEKCIYKDD